MLPPRLFTSTLLLPPRDCSDHVTTSIDHMTTSIDHVTTSIDHVITSIDHMKNRQTSTLLFRLLLRLVLPGTPTNHVITSTNYMTTLTNLVTSATGDVGDQQVT